MVSAGRSSGEPWLMVLSRFPPRNIRSAAFAVFVVALAHDDGDDPPPPFPLQSFLGYLFGVGNRFFRTVMAEDPAVVSGSDKPHFEPGAVTAVVAAVRLFSVRLSAPRAIPDGEASSSEYGWVRDSVQ